MGGSELLTYVEGRCPEALVADRLWAGPRLAAARTRRQAGQPFDRLLAEIRLRIEGSRRRVLERERIPLVLDYPDHLPVSSARAELVALATARCPFVLTGETGSGKTTQLPKMLLEAGLGRRGLIAVTQPRRVAAIAVAARIREELAAPGQAVAHSVRFDDRAGDDTLVRVMTDGLLLAEATADPLLSRYEAVVVDEAHERSLNIDLLLGLLVRLRRDRPDLLLAASSASIAADRFASFLGGEQPARIVAVGGRTFPVDIRWEPPGDDDLGYLAAAVAAVRRVHDQEGPGDVLVFLPTERDILEAERRLRDLVGVTLLPLFGRLTPGEQQRIFTTVRGRKIVLATNIAETSLTIPGIVYVVDAGLARLKRYVAQSRTERLPVEAVSQASCLQRAGRAGRIAPGICIRLFAAEDFANRSEHTDPEILRSNLAGVLLQCLAMGITDPESFPWLDAPPPGAWHQARVQLDELGAIHLEGAWASLTALGRSMARLPADPAVARILLAGIQEGIPHEACTIAAFLSVQDPRVRPVGQEAKADAAHRQFHHEAGDLASVLKLWDAYAGQASNSTRARFCESAMLGVRRMREWSDVRHQFWSALRETPGGQRLPANGHASGSWPVDPIHRAVLAGTLGQVLMYDPEKRTYRSAGGRDVAVHPGSALRSGKGDDGRRAPPAPPWLVACELVETSRLFARLCAPIDPEWVVTLAGDRAKRTHREPRFEPRRRQMVCSERVTWRGLPVRDGRLVPYERVDPVDATRRFAIEALAGSHAEGLARDVPALARNVAVVDQVRSLRHRLRKPELDVDPVWLEQFYAGRLGEAGFPVASTDGVRRLLRERGEHFLDLDPTALADADLLRQVAEEAPEVLTCGRVQFPLVWRYRPGEDDDGVTVEVREDQLTELDPLALSWVVGIWLDEMVGIWLRLLPKESRRNLQPLAENAVAIASGARSRRRDADPVRAVHAELVSRLGPTAEPDQSLLPPYLRPRIRLIDQDGRELAVDRDLASLMGGRTGDPLAALRLRCTTVASRAWPDIPGRLPREERVGPLVGHLALVRDRLPSGAIAARVGVFASLEAARAWHGDGVEALLEAVFSEELSRLAEAAMAPGRAAVVERGLGARIGVLRRHLALHALRAGMDAVPGDATAFAELVARARALVPAVQVLDAGLERAGNAALTLRGKLQASARSMAAAAAVRALTADLERLLGRGWWTRLPWPQCQRLDGHLEALSRRLAGAGGRSQDVVRIAERSGEMAGEFEHAVPEDPPLIAALGLQGKVREAFGALIDAQTALATPGAGLASGFAERRLRELVREIAEVMATARRGFAAMRDRLMAARQQAAGLGSGRVRDRLVADLDRCLAGYPDRSLGADLVAQGREAQALVDRVRQAVHGR